MAQLTINLSNELYCQAKSLSHLREGTIEEAILWTLEGYLSEALEEADDIRQADVIEAQMAAGAPTYSHQEVLASLALSESALLEKQAYPTRQVWQHALVAA